MPWLRNDDLTKTKQSTTKLYVHISDHHTWCHNINGLVQERRNSSASAMELRLSCTNALMLSRFLLCVGYNLLDWLEVHVSSWINIDPWRCPWVHKLVIFQLISRTFPVVALRWMPQVPHRWLINIGSSNGIVLSGNKPLFTQPFVQAEIKENIEAPCHWPSPVTGQFPTQRASNAENVSIWWYHHAMLTKFYDAKWHH